MDDSTFVVSMVGNHPKWMTSLSWPRRILCGRGESSPSGSEYSLCSHPIIPKEHR